MKDCQVLESEQIDRIRDLDGGKGAILAKLVGMFVARAADYVDRICEHAGAARMDDLAAAAHKLKGASGNLGAARLAFLCDEIEQAAHANAAGQARELVARMQTEILAACDALKREAARGS